MIHFFDGVGALCGEPSVRNWTLNRTFVSCSACATTLVHEGRERFTWPPPRLAAKIAAAPIRLR